jgi:subtilase family serine protease
MSMTRGMRRLAGRTAGTLLVSAAVATVPAAAQAHGTARPTARVVCGTVRAGYARCLSLVRTGRNPRPADGLPAGYGPTGLQAAYSLPAARGSGETVAVVDAFDDPNAESDLAVYRSTYGLPPCTVASGCLQKLNEEGQTGDYPPENAGWALEISADLDMVSAACPNCHIELVEADTNSIGDLAVAEHVAVASGAIAVSNSYGAAEWGQMSAVAGRFRHQGTTFVASSGDAGFGTALFPAVLPTVIGVGGTSLTTGTGSRGYAEQAWSLGGSGCSAYVAKPAWQHDTHCHMRTVADVSAVADPATGVAVYDTVPYLGETWYVVGGTSVASPLIAGVVALSGRAVGPSYVYAHHSLLNDVTGGTNATVSENCGGDYLCVARKGYDAPTGWGTPDGTGAF